MNPPPGLIDARPYCELVRALYLAGYGCNEMARFIRLERKTVRRLAFGDATWIQRRTAERVRGLLVLLPSESGVA